jgi:osmotically inducible protein OsmC
MMASASPAKAMFLRARGILQDQGYSFGTRFEGEPGTNPEELIAAAHAACFTMALSFGLAKEGFTGGNLETSAEVKLEQEGEGFKVSRSDLNPHRHRSRIDEERFRTIAEGAKANCPISKLLNAEIGFEWTLNG